MKKYISQFFCSLSMKLGLFKITVSILIIHVVLLLASCGGGGGGSSSGAGQAPSTQVSPKFKTTALLSGEGQVTQFAVSGTTLFWADESYGKGIWKYTTGNESPELLVPRLIHPTSLVVSGNYFYWVSSNTKKSLYRTSLDGSKTTLLREGSLHYLGAVTDDYPTLLIDETAVYWKTNDSSPNAVSIERIPLDGSKPQTLYVSSREVMALTTDGNYIYWLEGKGFSEAKLVRINKSGGLPETVCESISNPIQSAITYASNNIFVGTYGQLLKIPTNGGTPTVLAEGPDIEPFGIITYQGSVYWKNYNRPEDQQSVRSVPAVGGSISVVAANVKQVANLVATSSGLYWTEAEPPYKAFYGLYRMLKKYSWNTGAIDTLANGIFISSFDVAGNYIYCTEFDQSIKYAEIARLPLSGGVREPLIGGINTVDPVTLYATPSHLLIGDDNSLKTVPIEGGITKTLLTNGRFKIGDIKEQNGTVFFTSRGDSSGVYKVPLGGGTYVALAEEMGIYGTIVSVEGGYVYYLLGQSNVIGWANQELRKVPINGGISSSVFKLPDGSDLEAFDGVGVVYWREWIWNDQFKHVKYDIASGKSVVLLSGAFYLAGFNNSSVFYTNGYNNVYSVPKNGGNVTSIVNIPYPLTIGLWVKSGENYYFSISYLDETQGYLTEIDFLEQLY